MSPSLAGLSDAAPNVPHPLPTLFLSLALPAIWLTLYFGWLSCWLPVSLPITGSTGQGLLPIAYCCGTCHVMGMRCLLQGLGTRLLSGRGRCNRGRGSRRARMDLNMNVLPDRKTRCLTVSPGGWGKASRDFPGSLLRCHKWGRWTLGRKHGAKQSLFFHLDNTLQASSSPKVLASLV